MICSEFNKVFIFISVNLISVNVEILILSINLWILLSQNITVPNNISDQVARNSVIFPFK